MTAATIIDFPARPEGRPSNAALQMENRILRATAERMAEDRVELDAELHAHVSERIEAAAMVLDLARRAQRLTAAGHSPAVHLHAIERVALREQMRAMSSHGPDLGGAA